VPPPPVLVPEVSAGLTAEQPAAVNDRSVAATTRLRERRRLEC
jgi:hypothetical protein